MINQPNTLVTTEWLYPLLKQSLMSLHGKLQDTEDANELALISSKYQDLSGVLKVANLSNFSNLAQAIAMIVAAVANGELPSSYTHKSQYASDLLLHELTNYVQTGHYHQELISNRHKYLLQVLLSHGVVSNAVISNSQTVSLQTSHLAASDKTTVKIDSEAVDSEVADTKSTALTDKSFELSLNVDNGISLDCLNEYIELPESETAFVLMPYQLSILSKAWRDSVQLLLKSNSNQHQYLTRLQKVAHYMQDDAIANQAPMGTNLWYLTAEWLESLTLNEFPSPTLYAYLLSNLDTIISARTAKKARKAIDTIYPIAKINNNLVDVYIQLRSLKVTTKRAQLLLTKIIDRLHKDEDFFPRLLSKLEHAIFQLDSPATILTPLKDIESQLHSRGWQHFQQQVSQVLNDLQMSMDSDELYAQMRWAIERQLQDLYAAMYSAYQTIDSEIGQQQPTYRQPSANTPEQVSPSNSSDELQATYNTYQNKEYNPQIIRKVRIAVEDIKIAFNDYVHEHDSDLLNKLDEFNTLESAFKEMGLPQVALIIARSSQIFQTIVSQGLTHITWELIEAIAEELASLEMFMDYLAQQSLDGALLEHVDILLEQAEQYLQALLDQPDLLNQSLADLEHLSELQDSNVTRYDDSGELAATTIQIVDKDYYTEIEPINSGNTTGNDSTTTHQGNKTPDLPLDFSENGQTSDATTESKELIAARAELKDDAFDMDEEIRDIFIEEADEVLETLDIYLPKWQADPQNLDPLNEIRRGFHTLKGSGRMVGAHNAGEMAWAVENLLNRVLNKSLAIDNQLIGFIRETRGLIPILVNDFAQLRTPSIDPAITVLKAHNLQQGRTINFGLHDENQAGAATKSTPVISHSIDVNSDAVGVDSKSIDSLSADSGGLQTDTLEPTLTNNTLSKQGAATVTQSNAPVQIGANEDELPAILQPLLAEVNIPKDADDADPDIKEIFIEEAEEVLEDITPLYQKWLNSPEDFDVLNDVRRGFHTLKGSGRMVGANSSAELAWAIENMMNRVLDRTVKPTQGLQLLVSDVIHAYPQLVDTYQQGRQDYPETMSLWIACANAYTKNLGDDFDYKLVSAARQNNTVSTHRHKQALNPRDVLESQRPDSEPEVVKDATLPSDANSTVLKNMTTANLKLQEASHVVLTHDEESEAFEEVFIEEAFDLIEKIEDFIEQNQNEGTIDIEDDIVRAFHTLRGASGSQSLKAISDVSSTVESSLEQLQQHDEPMTASHLEAIAQSVSLIKQYVEGVWSSEETTQSRQEVETLQEMFEASQTQDYSATDLMNVCDIISDDIDDLLDGQWELEGHLLKENLEEVALYAEVLGAQCQKLLSRIGDSKKFISLVGSLEAAYHYIKHNPTAAHDDNVINSLLAGHEQLTGLFDSLAGSMTLKLDQSVVENLHELAKSAEAPLDNSRLQPIEYEEVNTDQELLEIFLEEAQEIDADITQSFSLWKDNPLEMNALKVLQRHLHTIKGGARMAGIASIGDLTHEAETIYEYFVEGKIEPTQEWVNIMQGVQDTLSQQIDYMVNKGRSFFVSLLVEQLHTLATNKVIPDNYRLELPNFSAPDAPTNEASESPQSEVFVLNSPADMTNDEFRQFKLQSWGGEEPDSDILEVFLEEAEELVDSSAINMQAFRNNTSNITVLQELQRELHTVKGGARMVAANGIADIAHHMETVYEDLASRRRPATKMVSQLLAICHDWIVEAVYLLKYGINPPEPTSLIEALKNFSSSPDNLQTLPKVSLQDYIEVINKYETWRNDSMGSHDISTMPPSTFITTQDDDSPSLSNEMIRVSSSLMEHMINLSGESSINRARIDMSMTSLNSTIDEMGMTVQRLADQLRRMDIELEAQILSQIDEDKKLDESFDPLEMDQYSSLNQLSKSLSESASDLLDIKTTLLDKTRDSEDLLLQLTRTQAELQSGLMNSRMVPFSRLIPRLQRIVRQTANELHKSVELVVVNADDEMDRTILERITSPLEHMLRNAVDHGIETSDIREHQGKTPTGHIVLEVTREGSEVVIKLSDDGKGINVDAVRDKAISQGLIDINDTSLTDLDVMQYIFNAGLTTTKQVTQISGRGVGMDVVLSEVRQLGGTVSVESKAGRGSVFAMRVPLTVAISDALVVRVADRYYAIPLIQIERVERINPEALFKYYQSDKNTFEIDDVQYRLRYLNEILAGMALNEMAVNMNVSLPVIIVKNQTGQSLAIQVDEIAGSRIEVVVKPLGQQLSHIAGLSAATIMGDGSVMLILDLLALIRNAPARSIHKAKAQKLRAVSQDRPKILVVDDSVTVRKVTTRLLERQGYDTYVARDGIDALEILQELMPDLMLLDIEMPRMDGFDVAQNVRHDNRLKDLPIIMITSRTGDKHRERAREIGVNDYMGKPFQEGQLVESIQNIIGVMAGDNYD